MRFYNTYASGPSRSSEKCSAYCAPIKIIVLCSNSFCYPMYVNVIENLNIGQYVKECIYGVRLDWLVYSLCAYKHIVCCVFVSSLPYTVVLNFFTTSKPNPEHRLRADFRV